MGTIVALAVVLIGGGIWWAFFGNGHSSADCAPVKELLAFNKAQVDALNAKTKSPEPGSGETASQPSALDYRAWEQGIEDRAARVTGEGLKDKASDLSKTVEHLVDAKIDYDAQHETVAPGAQPPALAMVVSAFNSQFEAQVGQLAKECPA